jgi:hypothetical protein
MAQTPRLATRVVLILHPNPRPIHLVRHSADSQEFERHLGTAELKRSELATREGKTCEFL